MITVIRSLRIMIKGEMRGGGRFGLFRARIEGEKSRAAKRKRGEKGGENGGRERGREPKMEFRL